MENPIKIKNWGSTPASNLSFESRLETISRDDELVFSYPSDKSVSGMIPRLLPNDTWPPANQIPPYVMAVKENNLPKAISSDDVENILKGKLQVVAIVKASYFDIFNIKHWSRACYFFENDALRKPHAIVSAGIRSCVDYNRDDKADVSLKGITPNPAAQRIDCGKQPDN